MGPANAQFFCWNQNALLKKFGRGNHGEITLSWMVKPVTRGASASPGLRESVAVLRSRGAAACAPAHPSRARDIARHLRLPLAGSQNREEDRATP
jgi:hypothetical protein